MITPAELYSFLGGVAIMVVAFCLVAVVEIVRERRGK